MAQSMSALMNFSSECEVWTVSNTLAQKTAHGTFNSTKGKTLPALQPGQGTAGADGKEIGCADSLL